MPPTLTMEPNSLQDSSDSSSGEEVLIGEEDFVDQDDGAVKKFTWHADDVRKLTCSVLQQMSSEDHMAPHTRIPIDWEIVSNETGIEEKKCQTKWRSLVHSVRTYRTLPEIAGDIFTLFCKSAIGKYNTEINEKEPRSKTTNHSSQTPASLASSTKKKKKQALVNPSHPKRPPVNGYNLFCCKNIGKITEKKDRLLKLGLMWKSLKQSERQKLNDECLQLKEQYFQDVKKYAKKHPEDPEIQRILQEETKSHLRRSIKHGSGEEKAQELSGSISESAEEEDMESMMNTTNSDSIPQLSLTSSASTKSPKKSRKKHKLEVTEQGHTSMKKVRHEKITGEDVYIQKKLDSYKEEHPDLEQQEILLKLRKKYEKLSEGKKAKYERKAEERN